MVASGWWWRGRKGLRIPRTSGRLGLNTRDSCLAASPLYPMSRERGTERWCSWQPSRLIGAKGEGARLEGRGFNRDCESGAGTRFGTRGRARSLASLTMPAAAIPARCAALALTILLPPSAHAQGIAGHVVDTLGRPLLAAVVTAQPGDGITRTDADGRFVLPTLGPGTYQLRIRRIGFRERLEEVTVRAGQRTRLTITLFAATPTLDTVRARVSQNACDNRTLLGFECRRQAGIGYFRDANELAALKPEHLLDLVRDLPGIRPRSGRGPNGLIELEPGVRPSRCLKTLVNGRPDFSPVFRRWSARDVVALEYYDQWSKIPLDYRQIADNVSCDLIVYWLRTAP
jgi:hypothetical protein